MPTYQKPHVILGSRCYSQILDVFHQKGHTELDTARMYCEGNTEEVLGELQVQKVSPNFHLHT
ncbi:hypothetical protein BC829DRAFT_398892, partial [Chytridium lagenaria]